MFELFDYGDVRTILPLSRVLAMPFFLFAYVPVPVAIGRLPMIRFVILQKMHNFVGLELFPELIHINFDIALRTLSLSFGVSDNGNLRIQRTRQQEQWRHRRRAKVLNSTRHARRSAPVPKPKLTCILNGFMTVRDSGTGF